MIRVSLEAAPALQRLLDRSTEFWELCEGAPPAPDAAAKEIDSIAPGKTLDDTLCFAVYEGEAMIAFVNLARAFPKPTEWWLALLLLDPEHRRRGLGVQVHREIVDFVAAQGATQLWLAVLTKNEPALRFWTRMGYIERERQIRRVENGYEAEVILMSLPLPAAPAAAE